MTMPPAWRNHIHGAIQPQSSDTKHVARWVWAVVVGVGAASIIGVML